MAKNKIRVAVIGGGNMGANHIRTYSHMNNADLTALVDVNPEAQKLADQYQIRYYNDYKQMVEAEKPTAVSVVVPTALHHSIGTDLIKRGIHCLIEKPIATTVKEADELIALANKQKAILTVGHLERFNPIIVRLKQMLDQKTTGKITSIMCKRVGGFPTVEPKTDVIIDLAVHDIDIISYLLGKQPNKIYSHGSRSHHSNKIDAAELLIDYGAASGFIQANWITPVKIRTIAVTGSKGYVEGNYITQELVHYEHNMKRVRNGFESFVTTLGEPQRYSIDVKFEEPLAVELHAFLERVGGKVKTALVDPYDARQALQFALAAVNKESSK